MNQGDSDNPDSKNAGQHTDANAKLTNGGEGEAIDTSKTATSSDSTGVVANTNGNGDAALAIDRQLSLSPGPHPEEAANGTEDDEAHGSGANGSAAQGGTVEEEGGAAATSDSQSSNDGDPDYSSDGFDPDLRRVKVYELIGSRWTDRGTAFCSGDFDEGAQEAKLIARSETNPSDVLLSCTIRANDVYQRQQDTLIVWTEPDGTDFALSFQDVEGCAEVWDFIVEVQRHLSSRAPQSSITTQQIISSGRLPTPDMGIIGEIEKAIRALARTPKAKENICNYIQNENYVHALIEVFNKAEDLQDVDTLHALCSCMQTILLLNEHQMYEHILSDELWLGVVGILEYDPEFPKYKANYREFLKERSKFLQPVSIGDQTVQRKIHHTYRLQYLKDVILGRALDDSTFNVLNSSIIFNQIDIINHVQQDGRFLDEVVALFLLPASVDEKGKGKDKEAEPTAMEVDKPQPEKSPTVNGVGTDHSAGPSSSPSRPQTAASENSDDVTRKKEVILLLQQLCAMGKNVQLPARVNLFRTLVERGVLFAVQWALCRPERDLISTAGDVLAVLLDHSTTAVRSHVMTQAAALNQELGIASSEASGAPNNTRAATVPPPIVVTGPPPFKETLAQVLCRMLANTEDLALQTQLADALRMLTDVPQSDGSGDLHTTVGAKILLRPGKDDHSVESFLENFYKVAVESLFRPLLTEVPQHSELKNPPLTPSREKANLYLYLCDLLCIFSIQHSFRSYFFVLSSNISSHVATLLTVRDKHLCLAALRFFRNCLRMNNRNLFQHLIKHDVFTPIVNLTVRESKRDNLLSSTCQEFFEHMRRENLREPIQDIFRQHEARIRELAKVSMGSATFTGLVARWEINNEPPPTEEEKKQRAAALATRPFGQGRSMDAEEEEYFMQGGGDDEDEDNITPVPRADTFIGLPRRKRLRVTVGSNAAPGAGAARGRGLMRPANVPSQRPASPLSSLLDYDEDDDVVQSPGLPGVPNPLGILAGTRSGTGPPTPSSPVLPHRQIQILPYEPPEAGAPSEAEAEPSSDPEDDLLEALVTQANGARKGDAASASASTSASSSASTSASTPASRIPVPSSSASTTKTTTLELPMRAREKRRRGEEDEEDGLLERLAAKSRRLSQSKGSEPAETSTSDRSMPGTGTGATKAGEGLKPAETVGSNWSTRGPGATKAGEEGPKKLRLKFSAAKGVVGAFAAAASSSVSSTPAASRPDPKEGDNG